LHENAGHLLLADDNEAFLLATAALLQSGRFRVELAHDVDEARSVLRRTPVDACIVDVNMPGNADFELARELRASFPLLPLVIVTGYPSVRTAVTALRLDAVDYLIKPFERAELLTTVCRAVSRRRGTARGGDPGVADGHDSTPVLPLANFQVPPSVSEVVAVARVAPGNRAGLSGRERQVVECLERGLPVRIIAATLAISANTVRNHLKSIFRKLGVHSQVELVARIR